ncbi:putrescine/spermidine ABC transporter permease [Acrocarpospora corrugata]|uniref:Putrescine/spermidine ABC transporter permease n=1 Tax=Acrocarpospora corrugata TaxID=35763 RepID=A0A5M3VWJ2_9ACTN|nr:ABC transporter permease [Acrocarpospora corrugata]GES00062.1 putrescine/spermidine ABC transporter permease [Acrocarpospora corrugata]
MRRRNRAVYAPLWLTYLFFYTPIAVMVVMSFNSSDAPFVFEGFSLKWYGALAENENVLHGLVNTLIVAVGTTVVATVVGTMLAVGLARHTRSKVLEALGTLPAILPELMLAVGLIIFYSAVQFTLGLHSILLAHLTFGIPLVAVVVRVRLASMDMSLEEASRDLGAGAVPTFLRITLPGLMPGVAAGALLAFTFSLDEFVLAFFTAEPTEPTLPIVIYSMIRFGVTPDINALATILLAVSCTAVIAVQRMTRLTESFK